jgi:hypothetical protein
MPPWAWAAVDGWLAPLAEGLGYKVGGVRGCGRRGDVVVRVGGGCTGGRSAAVRLTGGGEYGGGAAVSCQLTLDRDRSRPIHRRRQPYRRPSTRSTAPRGRRRQTRATSSGRRRWRCREGVCLEGGWIICTAGL